MKLTTKLWIGVGILAIISPIGIILPDKLKAQKAWGEWSAEEIKGRAGYVPAGLKKLSSIWKSIMPDYSLRGWKNKEMGHASFAYIIAGIIGMGLCAGTAYLLGKFLVKKKKDPSQNK